MPPGSAFQDVANFMSLMSALALHHPGKFLCADLVQLTSRSETCKRTPVLFAIPLSALEQSPLLTVDLWKGSTVIP